MTQIAKNDAIYGISVNDTATQMAYIIIDDMNCDLADV